MVRSLAPVHFGRKRDMSGSIVACGLSRASTDCCIPERMTRARTIAFCSLAALVALYIVGAVSNGVLRHVVQTLPLWFSIFTGLRQREVSKWAALPCFAIWLTLMTLIWAFLLGWTKMLSGFTPIEVVLTIVIGIASVLGLVVSFSWRTSLSWSKGLSVATVFAIFQMIALRISFLPSIARDR
jgi:hypothetical protein